MMTYAERRRLLKGRILYATAVMASEAENWELVWDASEELELTEATVASVVDEIADELHRRAGRLDAR